MVPDIDFFWVQLFINYVAFPLTINIIHMLFVWFNMVSLKETATFPDFKLPLCILWLIGSLIIFSTLTSLVVLFTVGFATVLISVILTIIQVSFNVFHIIKENERRSKQKSGF